MLLHDKSGIACDSCSTQYRRSFVYFSLDVKMLEVRSGVFPTGPHRVVYSLDYCESCMAELCTKVVKHYAPTNTGVNCDCCAARLRDNFDFFIYDISKATITSGAGSVIQSTVDKEYAKLTLCADCYRTMVARSLQLRSVAGEFSTSSD